MSRNLKLNYKFLKTKMSVNTIVNDSKQKSLSKTKNDPIMNTVESISTPINTVESIRKPFISLKTTSHIPLAKIAKASSSTTSTVKPKPSSKAKNTRTTTSSPNKAEVMAKFKEELIEKDKAIAQRDQEIAKLKDQQQLQEAHIKAIGKELTLLKENKQEETEYDEYAKKQMVRNVKILSAENRQLHEEVNEYKKKEIKLMKLLFEMKKRGIPIEDIIDCVDELSSKNNNGNPSTENSEVSAMFIPLILNTEDNFTVKPEMIPKLNFNQLNEKYNMEHICFPAKQTNTQAATSGTSSNTLFSPGTSNHSHSHDTLNNNHAKQQHSHLNQSSHHPIKLNPNSTSLKGVTTKKKEKN